MEKTTSMQSHFFPRTACMVSLQQIECTVSGFSATWEPAKDMHLLIDIDADVEGGERGGDGCRVHTSMERH